MVTTHSKVALTYKTSQYVFNECLSYSDTGSSFVVVIIIIIIDVIFGGYEGYPYTTPFGLKGTVPLNFHTHCFAHFCFM